MCVDKGGWGREIRRGGLKKGKWAEGGEGGGLHKTVLGHSWHHSVSKMRLGKPNQ